MNLYEYDYINIDGNWIHKTAIITDAPSKHKGDDVGEDSEYRRMKNEELQKAKEGHSELIKQLTKSN